MSVPDYSTLRALAQQATPGPWEVKSRGRWATVLASGGFVADTGAVEISSSGLDAAYIAAVSPTVLTTILDELERQAAQITAVRAVLGNWEQDAATLPPAALNLIDDVRTALDAAQTGEPT